MTEEEYEDQLLREERANFNRERYGEHKEIINKMRSFLAIAGEKTSKDTHELFREHIPRDVFGMSSDEVADEMGISENELMSQLTDNLNIRSRVRSSPVKFAKVVLNAVERIQARERKRLEKVRQKYGGIYLSEVKFTLDHDITII